MRALAVIIAVVVAIGAVAGVVLTQRLSRPETKACNRSVEHEFMFSNPDAPDTASAASEGETCAAATVTLVARDASGAELWRYSADYLGMAFGAPRPEGAPDVPAEEMDEFLSRWADVTVSHAAALPAWPQGAARPGGADAEALATGTPLARTTYEDLRARDAPTVCYAAAMEVSHCLALDAETGRARVVAAFGPQGVDLEMER